MSKVLLNLIFFAMAAGLGVGLSIRPWKVYLEQRHATDLQVQQMREAERRELADMEKEARIGSTIGREVLARSAGYHRHGEVPLSQVP
jgi:hypothetical protein